MNEDHMIRSMLGLVNFPSCTFKDLSRTFKVFEKYELVLDCTIVVAYRPGFSQQHFVSK